MGSDVRHWHEIREYESQEDSAQRKLIRKNSLLKISKDERYQCGAQDTELRGQQRWSQQLHKTEEQDRCQELNYGISNGDAGFTMPASAFEPYITEQRHVVIPGDRRIARGAI